jgi:hypothetical protein
MAALSAARRRKAASKAAAAAGSKQHREISGDRRKSGRTAWRGRQKRGDASSGIGDGENGGALRRGRGGISWKVNERNDNNNINNGISIIVCSYASSNEILYLVGSVSAAYLGNRLTSAYQLSAAWRRWRRDLRRKQLAAAGEERRRIAWQLKIRRSWLISSARQLLAFSQLAGNGGIVTVWRRRKPYRGVSAAGCHQPGVSAGENQRRLA